MELYMGIVGAGNFACFAAKAFQRLPGVRIIAVMDRRLEAAKHLADLFGAIIYTDYESFLANKKIALVYIATPPFLHYQQSKLGLLSGKHVICEKPAALQLGQAEELSQLSKSLGLLYVVNLMQRYNPLYNVVKTVIEENMLGGFLHGYFENYASDENLPPEHWFWDASKSGGIFIEHGVHFFDMFSGWLGEGRTAYSILFQNSCLGKIRTDQVQATVHYSKGMVNFYHGFNQPRILDRQEMRLQFEWGDITLHEWIPVKMKLHGLMQKGNLKRLQKMVGERSRVRHSRLIDEPMQGRFSQLIFEKLITLEYQNIMGKQEVYRELIMAMLSDQWKWIRDPDHIRSMDDNHAVQSLKMAQDATQMAKIF